MRPLPAETLLSWALDELDRAGAIYGIPREAFWVPAPDVPYRSDLFGHPLGTPVGPAAGPHTQLAQNIVAAWLCGGRFIELKTVQIMDELDIPRPCIDMEDEGYNVEWSQELRLDQSAGEYVKAWVLVHVLHRHLGFPGQVETVFNMSVGYNLDGIRSGRMTAFMDRLTDAADEIAELQKCLRAQFPRVAEIEIPGRIADSVTLSTMHGCPPDEIEKIGRYLLEERGVHTYIKLNPTLLGKDEVLGILHHALGFREIEIPNQVFDHDLQYDRAVALLRELRAVARERGLAFGVKLSNTLAMANHKRYLPGDEVYMSGRALYPITMTLFHRLEEEFAGDLPVSFAGGADSVNVATVLACGAQTVTAASDLLKPGGYGRLRDWLTKLGAAMERRGARNLAELAADRRRALAQAAADATSDPRYHKAAFPHGLPKTERSLTAFDCIAAPCVEKCPIGQDVPEYAWAIAHGDLDQALAVVLARNPLPGILGYICTHVCETRCTRNTYEEPVAIRALKRVAFDGGREPELRPAPPTGRRVAVIGGGPAGLSAAYFLALSGVGVTVFEAGDQLGGMPALAPAFRIPQAVIDRDVGRVRNLGVELRPRSPVREAPERLLEQGFDAVFVAVGLPADARLGIPREDGPGVFGAVDFLRRVRRGEAVAVGPRVVVVGGGNVAMDAARTAARLAGRPVTVAYRRSRAEMPADRDELEELLLEGNEVLEQVAPVEIVRRDGRVVTLRLVRTELGPPGEDGRRAFAAVPGSEFDLPADTVIVAVGQRADAPFLGGSRIARTADGRIRVDAATGRASADPVYAGGDLVRGAATIVAACADGRRAAEAICRDLGVPFRSIPVPGAVLSPAGIRAVKVARTQREGRCATPTLPADRRGGWDLVEAPLTPDAARAEALRCLQCSSVCDKCVEVCPNRANFAWTVEPVRWAVPVVADRGGTPVVVGEEPFVLAQGRQIAHVVDLCNECGNCGTFCVHQGRPFLDKPRLYLDPHEFRRAGGPGFHVAGGGIVMRQDGREARLSGPDPWAYEDDEIVAVLDRVFRPRELRLKRALKGPKSLRPAAEMAILLTGLEGTVWVGGCRG
ncbi:MAG: Glutamate synthase [NADPH] small chain [Candidatus Bipolaricaulis sibiricus]|uniref:Glutamate synthase [NADPH] small chain n=1 Tax=Bipolaricaulis sibiricus TaxID=2501609 RepID=A0A410FTA6_BIPS1|nr:MAG: Glutamate synthase [NADPH] small chain [Candidatus Bipolaricaulis sibiricus]